MAGLFLWLGYVSTAVGEARGLAPYGHNLRQSFGKRSESQRGSDWRHFDGVQVFREPRIAI